MDMKDIIIRFLDHSNGPKALLVAHTDSGWIHSFGLCLVIGILIPNIIYWRKGGQFESHYNKKVVILAEQLGRYLSMFFIVFNIGIWNTNVYSTWMLFIYYVGSILLLIAYYIIWIMFYKNRMLWKSMSLAILPTAIFLLSGIANRKYILILSAILFGASHIYITYQNEVKS